MFKEFLSSEGRKIIIYQVKERVSGTLSPLGIQHKKTPHTFISFTVLISDRIKYKDLI